MFGLVATFYVRRPSVDYRTALIAAIERSNRNLVARITRTTKG